MIHARLQSLRAAYDQDDVDSLIFHLRSGLLRNLGGIGKTELYSHAHVGTKDLIEDYLAQVVKSLDYIRDTEFLDLSCADKNRLFRETRHAFGRSALLLSGGAGFGMYHLGIVKALHEQQLLPRVISGSSVGSLVAAALAVTSDEELPSLFQPGALKLDAFDKIQSGAFQRRVKRFLQQGYLMDSTKLEEMIRDNIGDVTFQEAFDQTGRIVNITVNSTRQGDFPRLLNYLTAPHVYIWSAATASCALTFLYPPVEIMAKDARGNTVPYHPARIKWSDGSVAYDLPMNRLSELFNVNHFIVSQVNPHVVPFVNPDSEHNPPSIWFKASQVIGGELLHRASQLDFFGLMPRFWQSIKPLFYQKYRGDVTIVPRIGWQDYSKLLKNPTDEEVQEAIRQGELATYPHIPIIRGHCAIESCLEEAVQFTKDKVECDHVHGKATESPRRTSSIVGVGGIRRDPSHSSVIRMGRFSTSHNSTLVRPLDTSDDESWEDGVDVVTSLSGLGLGGKSSPTGSGAIKGKKGKNPEHTRLAATHSQQGRKGRHHRKR
eukprot:TRINITY_DN7615_c0_g1_i4.p1 TRINITY_DN7615_c0_g1~~TRINITY_DN7615_c0_g1_i4.p1  ORF type:complete len:546 (-),score=95.47 TRINITY_DN7615_c0_g1_i4:877-2514(-)